MTDPTEAVHDGILYDSFVMYFLSSSLILFCVVGTLG